MQRPYDQIMLRGEFVTLLLAQPDLSCSREEDQHIAIQFLFYQTTNRPGDLLLERQIVGSRQMFDGDWEKTPFRPYHRAVSEKRTDRNSLKRCRHDDEPKVWTCGG